MQQRIGGAVLVGSGNFPVIDEESSLRRDGEYGTILKLSAVHRVGQGPSGYWVHAGYAEPEQQTPLGVVVVGRRLGASVQGMAGRAGLGVEGRAQAVPGFGGGGGGYPVLGEKAVANLEGETFMTVQIGGGEGEGVAVGALDRGLAAELRLQDRGDLSVAGAGSGVAPEEPAEGGEGCRAKQNCKAVPQQDRLADAYGTA